MEKLICIDVDGTLVHGEYQITNLVKQALSECDAKKILVSGRTVDELLKLESNFDLIGSNGGEIFKDNKFTRKLNIPISEALKIIKEINTRGYYMIVHTDDGPIIEYSSENQVKEELSKILKKYNLQGNEYEKRFNHMFNHIFSRSIKVDNLSNHIIEYNISINKLESHFELDKKQLFAYLNENYNVEAFNSAGSNIEIVPNNALKGNAILEYVQTTNYKIISIGDGNNDIPMFEVSDYKIAMGNGTEELKQAADLIVSSGEKGIVEALKIIDQLKF